jgi:hypothetical protein
MRKDGVGLKRIRVGARYATSLGRLGKQQSGSGVRRDLPRGGLLFHSILRWGSGRPELDSRTLTRLGWNRTSLIDTRASLFLASVQGRR